MEDGWPFSGAIKFEELSMKYREGLEPALRKLTCEVEAGKKIGIVGRTGAGKSTILQVLFRLTDGFEGDLLIDGQSIYKVGLHTLRKQVAYIPQAPFLLQGSIRQNLDPFNEFTDE